MTKRIFLTAALATVIAVAIAGTAMALTSSDGSAPPDLQFPPVLHEDTVDMTKPAPCQQLPITATTHGVGVNIVVAGGPVICFNDAAPYIDPKTNRTMIPLRHLMEALGAEVRWDQARQTAVVRKGGTVIEMPVGSDRPKVNGQERTLDAPAVMFPEEWRVFVPLRFVTEVLGGKAEFLNPPEFSAPNVVITLPE